MDMGFYGEQGFGVNPQGVCFQSSPRENKSEMIVMGGLHRMNSIGSLSFSGNSGIVNGGSSFTGVGNSCDSVTDLKQRTSLAVEWSVEEQYKLEEALPKYADEPGIIRYVKIAATLRNKTVRDVALRCRWMGRKRRKQEELNLWKKTKDKKDKLMESSLKPSVHSYSTINVAPFSLSMNRAPAQGDGVHVEGQCLFCFFDDKGRSKYHFRPRGLASFATLVQSITRHLLEQNSQVLGQISTNMCALRLQDNVDLFSEMKDNITAILYDMRCMPGPPLPVTLNEDFVNSILSLKSQTTTMFASSGGMNMKQEPGCW